MIEFLHQHGIALLISVPLLSAFLVPILDKISSLLRNIFVLFAMFFTAILAVLVAYFVLTSGIITYTLGSQSTNITLPSGLVIPVRIILVADAFSAFMILSSTLILLVATIYSFGSIKDSLGKYFSLFFHDGCWNIWNYLHR
ncbi:MAG: hypothetical protein QXM75_03855 [Candidatus Diapherotrites archaeon]